MNWLDKLFRSWGYTRRPAVTTKPRGFRPGMESLETREVPAVLQGYAFIDNGDKAFGPGDTAKQGATIRLDDGAGHVTTTTTDASGFYQFANVDPGKTYTLTEVASGYTAIGAQANTAFSAAAVNGDKSIQVTIPDSVSVNRLHQADSGLPGVDAAFTLNGGPFNGYTQTASPTHAHQYELELTSSENPAAQTIYSFCVDLFHANPTNYTVTPSSTPDSSVSTYNLDRIGYLYNKYGTQQLGATQGTGLALAMYELLYDQNPNLDAGNFVLQAGTNSDARTAAQAYLDESAAAAGKVGPLATFLNVTGVAVGDLHSQGMLATETYNFLNQVAENPGVSLTKKADCTVYKPGDTATYTYVVTNTGNVPLSNVKIVDDNATPGNTADDFVVAEGVTLGIGQSMTFTRQVALPSTVTANTYMGGMFGKCWQAPTGDLVLTNKAVVTGTSPSGQTVTACATATVVVRATPTCDNGSHGKGSHGKCDNGSHGKGSYGKCDNGSNGKNSSGKGSHSVCDNGSHGKGSNGKGSGVKCDNGHGSNGRGSSGKGGYDRCDNGGHSRGSSGKGSYGKGSSGKGSGGKGSYDRCEPIRVCVPVVKVCAPPVKLPSRGRC